MLSAILISYTAGAGEQPLTLKDCYELALKQSESIAINKETINEAEGRFVQALGLILPHVSFSSTDTRMDKDGTSGLFPQKSRKRGFVISQTLFSGFKEFISMSGSSSERRQREYETRRAEQLLLSDVAAAFYLFIEQRENLKALRTTRAALINRIQELQDRERIGRSRTSEVVTVQTQLYAIDAQIESGKSQEAIASQLLEFLTGQPVGSIADSSSAPAVLNAQTGYLSKAVERPDVMAAREAWTVARKLASVKKTDLLPSVSVSGNYYTSKSTQPQDSEWDAALSVNVPIFKGTETYGAIMEANAKARESEYSYRRARRLAEQDIKDSYQIFNAAMLQKDALKKAFTSARLNYTLQRKDYRLNLVNNLDVLQAIQTLQDARISYVHALYEVKRRYWELLASTGEAAVERIK